MHISTKVEKCLVEVILEVYKKLLEDPAYSPPSSREIKAEITKRLNEKYPGEKLKIGLGTVQARLQKLLGPEIHEKHYTATISEEVEKFLRTQAYIIKTGVKDPQYIAPKTEQIIETCKIVTGENVSPPTVNDRFQKLLGRDLYSKIYPKIGGPINLVVEQFLMNKANELKEVEISSVYIPAIEEICDECYLTTNFTVCYPTVVDRLRTQLGKEKYFQLFTKKASSIDKTEQDKIGIWWITQAERMLNDQNSEVETITAYIEQTQRDYATIRKYGEKALKHEYGDARWQQIYLDLTTIQRENWAIGFVNHQLLERVFQRGFATACQHVSKPAPEMFREVNLTPETRCDLLIADIYRGRFMESCLERGRAIRTGKDHSLAILPQSARRYTDVIIDFTTRYGQELLKIKAKYCDGKTLVIVACTGEFPPDVGYIRHPDYPDVVEISASDLGRLFCLPEESLAEINEILELTSVRDWEGLRNRLLADRARHPGEIDWETKRFWDYESRRDPGERKGAEAAAFQFRQKEKGQHVIDNFYARECKGENTARSDIFKGAETPPAKETHEDKKLEQGLKIEKQGEPTQEIPLTGTVGEDWILNLLKKPVKGGKPMVDPFFETARERGSFRRNDLKEKAAIERVESEHDEPKIQWKEEKEPVKPRKERIHENCGGRFHAFWKTRNEICSISHFYQTIK